MGMNRNTRKLKRDDLGVPRVYGDEPESQDISL